MKTKPLFLVFLIVFIDLMGFGIVIPLLPLYGERYHPTPIEFGALMAIYSLMQFLFAPVLGRFSDHFGRRPILLVSLLGTVAGYLLFAFQHSLGMLFLARLVAGVMGANVATAQAVIADVTIPEERAKGMGLIGAAFGLGFILGPAIGGISVRFGESAPGLFAAGLSGIAFLLATFVLPETNPPSPNRGQRPPARGWFSPGKLVEALRHPQVGLLLIIFFLATLAFANFESTFALFAERRLSLDVTHVTYLFVFVGVLAAIVQGGLIGRLVKRFGERLLIFVGALLLVPGYLALTVVASVPQLLVFLGFLALGAGLTGPCLSSLISKLSGADEQGGILGIGQSLSSLARILGPFWGVYSFRALGLPAPYLTAAGIVLAVVGFAWVVLARAKRAELEGRNVGALRAETLTPPG